MHEFEIDGFLFSFPLRTIMVDPEQDPLSGTFSLRGFATVEVAGRKCLAVFTDKDLTDRYLDEVGDKTKPIGRFETPKQFLTLLEKLGSAGIDWVTFDPERAAEKARVPIAVQKLIEAFRGS